MAGVEDVEATVGEDDPLAPAPGQAYRREQLLPREHALVRSLRMGDRLVDLRGRDRRGAHSRADQPRGEVGDACARHGVPSQAQTHRQRRRHGVAGPRAVVHLDIARRQVTDQAVVSDDRGALTATGHDQRLDVHAAQQRDGPVREIRLVGPYPCGAFELAAVRLEHVCPRVAAEVLVLGIHHDADTRAAGRPDQGLRALHGPLVVVLDHQEVR